MNLDVQFLFSMHTFVMALAMLAVSRKHAFAISSDFENPEVKERVKQYNRFFNFAMLCGVISLAIIAYVYSTPKLSESECGDMCRLVSSRLVAVTWVEVIFIAITFFLCFYWGGIQTMFAWIMDRF